MVGVVSNNDIYTQGGRYYDSVCLVVTEHGGTMFMQLFLFLFLIVKLPQILKIIRNNSIEGLSYLSFLFELTAFTITSGYNYSKKFAFRFVSFYTDILLYNIL